MARYALIRPDNSIDRFAHDGQGGIDPSVKTRPGWRWLPCPAVAAPAHDPETQAVVGPTYTANANDVTEAFSVRNLTAAEIDARKDAKVGGLADLLIRALHNHENRIRSQAVPQQPSVTLPQFRAALKALL